MYWFPMINFGIKEIYFVSKNNRGFSNKKSWDFFLYYSDIYWTWRYWIFVLHNHWWLYVFFFHLHKKLIHGPSLYRPNIADQHKVGFFTLDRCSQTEVTEVVDLKEMTEVLQILLQVMLVSSTTSVLKNQCPHYPVSSTSRL